MTKSTTKTRLAILRTIGSLHAMPLSYDLQKLRSLVAHLAPDLLCADITRTTWESGDLSLAPPEIREALAPVSDLTDTVLVPVAPTPQQYADFLAPPGVREWLASRFDKLLRWGQRKANSPEGIHGMAFQLFCHTVCALEEMTWKPADRQAYYERTKALANNILATIQSDPGRRVLVVIQCQFHHTLEPYLNEQAGEDLEILDYWEL